VQNGPAPYATVAITSARAARYLPSVLDQCANDAVIAVVGPATHAAVLAAGVGDHAIVGGPAAIDAAALATVINRGPVLHLGAATPRAELADGVAMRGLSFTHVTCYSTRPRVLDGLEQEKLNLGDIIAISAPSAWQVAKEHVRTSTMIVVPGATTADAVRADHERVQLSATLLTTLQELVGS
jgi:uroporphyrinogen-III synthase